MSSGGSRPPTTKRDTEEPWGRGSVEELLQHPLTLGWGSGHSDCCRSGLKAPAGPGRLLAETSSACAVGTFPSIIDPE